MKSEFYSPKRSWKQERLKDASRYIKHVNNPPLISEVYTLKQLFSYSASLAPRLGARQTLCFNSPPREANASAVWCTSARQPNGPSLIETQSELTDRRRTAARRGTSIYKHWLHLGCRPPVPLSRSYVTKQQTIVWPQPSASRSTAASTFLYPNPSVLVLGTWIRCFERGQPWLHDTGWNSSSEAKWNQNFPLIVLTKTRQWAHTVVPSSHGQAGDVMDAWSKPQSHLSACNSNGSFRVGDLNDRTCFDSFWLCCLWLVSCFDTNVTWRIITIQNTLWTSGQISKLQHFQCFLPRKQRSISNHFWMIYFMKMLSETNGLVFTAILSNWDQLGQSAAALVPSPFNTLQVMI